jgi:hypothetical protein
LPLLEHEVQTPPVHWPLVQSASSTQIPASAHVLPTPLQS